MVAAAIALMVIGTAGVFTAVGMELKTHDPIYKVLMKIFPWVFGVGAVLLAIVIAGG